MKEIMENLLRRLAALFHVPVLLRRGDIPRAKSFATAQKEEEAFEKIEHGIRPVRVKKIVGSVGRYSDFDQKFRLKGNRVSPRLEGIKDAMQKGVPVPPITAYRIKDEYFVLDGNHRVAAARALGLEFIDANVTEFLPAAKSDENILYLEKSLFFRKTGLDVGLELTEPGQYTYLLRQINQHFDYLKKVKGLDVDLPAAADDWYRTIFSPFIRVLRKRGLASFFPGRTAEDLYAYITSCQWKENAPRHYETGVDRCIPPKMEDFRERILKRKPFDSEQIEPKVTAFVLINVKSGGEYRVMERLYRMKEILEVYFVHGSCDLVARIETSRSLAVSDAEIIGKIVAGKIRRIRDVTKTQTLIPIAVKRKA